MRGKHWIAGLLLVLPLGAMTAQNPAKPVDFSASAWVDVDASGKAHVVDMDKLSKFDDVPELASISEAIKKRLRDRIESWQFVPAAQDGVAVASSTNVHLTLEGMDDGIGGLAIRLRSASTGAKIDYNNMQALSSAGFDASEEGAVIVDVKYGEDGHVLSVDVHDSKTFDHGKFVKRASQDLRKGFKRAAKTWVFKPEQIAGKSVAGSGRVPIVFCMSEACTEASLESGIAHEQPRLASNEPAAQLPGGIIGTTL